MSSFEPSAGPDRLDDWLAWFNENPDEALSELMEERFYLGAFQVVSVEDVLIDLAYDSPDFQARVDVAMAQWIASRGSLGRPSPEVRARAWSRIGTVAANLSEAPETARALKEIFDADGAALTALSTSPSTDPAGRCLLAIARHQTTREYLPQWWRICELEPGVFYFHANVGIEGLRNAPIRDGDEDADGDVPQEPLLGALRLANAFAREVEAQRLPKDLASREWISVARITRSAYPFAEPWRRALESAPPRSELATSWIREVFPDWVKRRPRRTASHHRPDLTQWRNRADKIVARLRTGDPAAGKTADDLLAEERAYAETSGDRLPLVLSLTRFAGASGSPARAVAWATEAVRWARDDPQAWLAAVEARLQAYQRGPALSAAFEATSRFPNDFILWDALGTALRKAARLDEAEEVFRHSIELSAANMNSWDGLAFVLAQQERKDEARTVYQQARERFPENPLFAKRLRDFDRLVKELGDSVEEPPEVEQAYPLLSQARLLRRLARRLERQGDEKSLRTRAEETIDRVRDSVPGWAAAEMVLLRSEQGRWADALEVASDAIGTIGNDVSLVYAAVRAARGQLQKQPDAGGEYAEIALLRRFQGIATARPFVAVVEARTYLAALNGAESHTRAHRALGDIRDLATVLKPEAFDGWWIQAVADRLFAPDDSLIAIAAQDQREARLLDGLEEDFATRLAVSL